MMNVEVLRDLLDLLFKVSYALAEEIDRERPSPPSSFEKIDKIWEEYLKEKDNDESIK